MRYNKLILLSIASTVAIARPNGKECWSEKFKIPCCQSTEAVVRTTYDGEWGMENGEWCGLGIASTRPVDDVPAAPPVIDYDSFVDPAADCDISDSITGESLAKAAPFRFGVGLNGVDLQHSTTTSETMKKLIKHQFTSMSYSNMMKSLFILDEAGSRKNAENGLEEEVVLNFSQITDGLEFAAQNGIHIRGHVLVWHTQFPDWFFKKGFNVSNENADVDTIYARLESYIKQYLGFLQFNYPGVVDVFDVVNEAIEIDGDCYDKTTGWLTRICVYYEGNRPNIWYELLGPDYVLNTFRIARKYALPNVKLVYNDYNTFQTSPLDKTQAIINLLRILKKEDLVDAIGMESYIQVGWPSAADYGRAIERFANEGLEIQITELTITAPEGEDWEQKQAEQYREIFEEIMKQYKNGVNISSVTVFGLQDGYRFYESDSTRTRLFDHDLQKKPNYHAIMDVLNAYNNSNVNDDEQDETLDSSDDEEVSTEVEDVEESTEVSDFDDE
nr:xylanase [Pecoramyces sp. F1]